MNMSRLPVPPLPETLQRYLQWVRPLLNDSEFVHSEAAVAAFASGEGQALQADLAHFAAEKSRSSWLIDAWLESYLACREPLPLASNVGFAVERGRADLAHWLAAAAAVHADYLQSRIEAPLTPQGHPVCMQQWQILQGAMRVAENGCDRYEFAEATTASRHIGVWYQGYYYCLPALDANGQAYAADVFQVALKQILADDAANPYPAGVPAFLGSGQWASIRHTLVQEPANATLLEQMKADLFHVNLYRRNGLSADEDLCHATFSAEDSFWPYKPITYRFNLATERLFLHCEHTWPDGGMLKGLVERAQQKGTAAAAVETHIKPTRYEWQLTEAQQQAWPQWQRQYAEQAAMMRVSSMETALAQPVPKGFSQDGLIQFALQYAQQQTYGRIRNTYEAVDVSHFQYGRTECIRPVSTESVRLVQALADNQADAVLLLAALAEHKNRVKACKSGHGVNRHLLGLKLMANRNGNLPALFADRGYTALTTDFLSTSTLGDGAAIRQFAFAPTSMGGLGINYTILPQSWLLTVSHTAAQNADVARFQVAFAEAAGKLLHLVGKAV